MTQKHLTQVWTFLGAILFYYVLSTWITTQGGDGRHGDPLFGKVFFPDAARIESLFALFIVPVLLIGLTTAGAAYAAMVGRVDWASRIPVVWLEGLDCTRRSGKVYQGVMLASLVLLPAGSLYHFLTRFAGATAIDLNGTAEGFAPFCLFHCPDFVAGRHLVGDGLTMANVTAQRDLGATVDWFPLWEPWLILGLLTVALLTTLRFLWVVFRFTRRA
jgi:hypothetical protein